MAKKKILFLTPYPFNKAPSQRLKFEQYYEYIEKEGFEVHQSSFMSLAFWKVVYKKGNTLQKFLFTLSGYLRRISDLFRIRKYDIVYIHLWVTPLGPPVFEWLIRKLAKRIIYDIDDLVYMSYEKGFLRVIKGKTKPIFLMKNADHVITCTPYLDEYVRKFNTHTTDISSTINTDTYTPVNPYSNEQKLVLGWSGSHSTSKYLHLLDDVLKEVYAIHPFKLLVMGDSGFHIEGIETEAIAWSESLEIPTLQQMDIGLYPLPLNDNWVMGKSGLKALQYMTLGIPTVATAIGANFRVIENGVSGFLVKTKKEWKDILLTLMDNQELRRQTGQAGRNSVEKEFSIKATAPVYISIINKTLASPDNY